MGGRGGAALDRSMRRLRRQKYDRDIMVRESAPDVPDAAARQDSHGTGARLHSPLGSRRSRRRRRGPGTGVRSPNQSRTI